jgi:hypothetical protein
VIGRDRWFFRGGRIEKKL